MIADSSLPSYVPLPEERTSGSISHSGNWSYKRLLIGGACIFAIFTICALRRAAPPEQVPEMTPILHEDLPSMISTCTEWDSKDCSLSQQSGREIEWVGPQTKSAAMPDICPKIYSHMCKSMARSTEFGVAEATNALGAEVASETVGSVENQLKTPEQKEVIQTAARDAVVTFLDKENHFNASEPAKQAAEKSVSKMYPKIASGLTSRLSAEGKPVKVTSGFDTVLGVSDQISARMAARPAAKAAASKLGLFKRPLKRLAMRTAGEVGARLGINLLFNNVIGGGKHGPAGSEPVAEPVDPGMVGVEDFGNGFDGSEGFWEGIGGMGEGLGEGLLGQILDGALHFFEASQPDFEKKSSAQM